MTTLISWASIDSRGPTAIYIASDSRVTWSPTPYRWDYCRKVFSLVNFPVVIGYCGDAFFVPQVLSQVIYNIDAGLIFSRNDNAETMCGKLKDLIISATYQYPKELMGNVSTILFCTIEASHFICHELTYRDQLGWENKSLKLPDTSDTIGVYGSGGPIFKTVYQSRKTGYSRDIFSSFCEAINSGQDPLSGGPPQLAGIYRNGQNKTFGYITDSERFVNGMLLRDSDNLDVIEWRNSLFERCDPNTLSRMEGAQRQPKVE